LMTVSTVRAIIKAKNGIKLNEGCVEFTPSSDMRMMMTSETLGNVGQTDAEILEEIIVLDKEFEGNLSTMLAPIRGTNQYSFRVKAELKAMIAEYGSPTLFLTLSCTEYNSADMAQY
uniref:Uncharacterized protein n=1 Tax=Amphimedon queenslandica TaxID=400682 RepID=A0A1X7TWH4_AMPQE